VPGPIYGVTEAGELQVRVPFVPDSTLPQGYVAGNVRIAIPTNGVAGASIPFTILPLTYTGDAVADFRALVDRVSATIKDSIAQQKSVPEWAARAATNGGRRRRYESAIRKFIRHRAAGTARWLRSTSKRSLARRGCGHPPTGLD